jgi:hypothetical protein
MSLLPKYGNALFGTLAAALLLAGSVPAIAQTSDAPKPADAVPGSVTTQTNAQIAPDIKPEALWDGRKLVPFHSLDAPKMVSAGEADFLDDADYILGVSANGESRAYPTRFIWWHHAINDMVGKSDAGGTIPIAVTYCSVCNTGICYDPMLNGKPVMLDFYGLYNGVVTLCDRDTESVFLQAEGRFVKGALTGTTLKTIPLLDTTWGQWKQLHPDTLVMSPDNPYGKYYNPKGRPEPRGYDRFPAPFFRPTVTRGDMRIPPFEKVLGVAVSETDAHAQGTPVVHALRRAYPLTAVQAKGCVLNDKLGKTSIGIFLDPDTMTAVAVNRTLEGRTLTFEAKKGEDGKLGIYDKQTRTHWNIEGKAEEGPLAGKALDRIENHLSQWYGWFAYFPETSIYGRRDAPLPGDPFAQEVGSK